MKVINSTSATYFNVVWLSVFTSRHHHFYRKLTSDRWTDRHVTTSFNWIV